MKTPKRNIHRAWTFYDWANSAYSLVISTAIFPIYYEEVTDELLNLFGSRIDASAVYAGVIALSFILSATLSPYLSALADVSGRKRAYMRFFVIVGSISCMSMYFFTSESVWIGLLAAFFASFGFSGSLVFYNSYLPQIALPEEQDKLSARGFILGYIGSSLLLVFLLLMVQKPEYFGLNGADKATRLSFVIVGLWWLGWSLYPLRVLPRNTMRSKLDKDWGRKAYLALLSVFQIFRKTKRLGRFVLAFFFLSCGVQTTILLATMFGTEVLDIERGTLILTVLIIQIVGIIGAWSFSRLCNILGNIKSVALAVFIWVGVCLAAFFVQSELQFMILGALVGLVMGGVQSIARSTYSKMLPATEDHTTFFSFYDVAEKLATAVGMFSVAVLVAITGDLRNAALALTVFFFISLIILFTIPRSKYVY